MHVIDLISSAITDKKVLPCDPVRGQCCLTGCVTDCIPRKKLFGKSFTNIDLFKSPDSDLVSVNAWYALKHKWERMSCWVTTANEFRRVNRQDIRKFILCGFDCDYPWAGYVTTSYKKHGALKTIINKSKYGFWLFDETIIDCRDNHMLKIWYGKMCKYQLLGISRPMIEYLEINPVKLKKVGVENWYKFRNWAKPRQGGLYRMLCYLLPTKEELKNNEKLQIQKDGVAAPQQQKLF